MNESIPFYKLYQKTHLVSLIYCALIYWRERCHMAIPGGKGLWEGKNFCLFNKEVKGVGAHQTK